MKARTVGLTAVALVGFAGNSLLCRLALAAGRIDAASFSAVRFATGALVLMGLAWRRRTRVEGLGGAARAWTSAAVLAVYAVPFSFAYLWLGAGVGALVLFGCVQATMIGWGMLSGERPRAGVWVGALLALGGLAWLTVPGAHAPPPAGVGLMAVAGVAWGVYSLRGRGGGDPLVANAKNFIRTVPMLVAAWLVVAAVGRVHWEPRGVVLAATSGTLASGVGYSLWYAALPSLTAAQAAVLQLLVPVLAAGGGIALLGERPTARLGIGAAAILGGVILAMQARRSTSVPEVDTHERQ